MSIRDKITAGEYKNKVPYSVDKVPIDEDKMTVRQAREHKEEQVTLRREHQRKYSAESSRLMMLFRADLESDNSMTNHPKANILWDMAYDRGHSSGYESIVSEYEELVELVK